MNSVKDSVEITYPFKYADHIEMQNLEKRYIPSAVISEATETFKWFNVDEKSAIVLKSKSKELLGHMSLFPLTRKFAEQLTAGLVNDIELSGEDIETNFSKTDTLYFCVICIDSEHRTKKNLAKLYLGYYDILDLYKYFNADFKRVLVECVTEDGIKLATSLGFKPITQEVLGIYECEYKLFEESLYNFASEQGLVSNSK